jgi:hypothetical protein
MTHEFAQQPDPSERQFDIRVEFTDNEAIVSGDTRLPVDENGTPIFPEDAETVYSPDGFIVIADSKDKSLDPIVVSRSNFAKFIEDIKLGKIRAPWADAMRLVPPSETDKSTPSAVQVDSIQILPIRDIAG